MGFGKQICAGVWVLLFAGSWSPVWGTGTIVRMEWRFSIDGGWGGWMPNGGIRDAQFRAEAVDFATTSGDSQILGPAFDLQPATNMQWVEIDLDCDGPGEGEFFYTNKSTGRYGGLEPEWMARITVPSAGRQTVAVWPFWEGLGKIVRVRFDPPDGVRCKLHAIRIMESSGVVSQPSWTFENTESSWQVMSGARLELAGGALRATALRPQAMIITPVEPFDATKRSLLRINANCPGEHLIGFYWVAKEYPGLMGEPVELPDQPSAGEQSLDLRRFPTWAGTITHLAIAFGTFGTETLSLTKLSIEPNDADQPFWRVRSFGFERAINRPGEPAQLRIVLDQVCGRAAELETQLETDTKLRCPDPALPTLHPGPTSTLVKTVWPLEAGHTTVRLRLGGQVFERSLRIDPPVTVQPARAYAVPPPRPVKTDYQLGVYYFPGWSADQMSRWEKQREFPEREPVLGWYAEGEPEVADWHIKWAVENGLSFFIYDWYWRDGHEELGAGLNQGFLRARYNGLMKFAVMWANHPPFSSHTPEQLRQVTGYWIEHYFRRPNYLCMGGQPYVSFFSPGELIANLGSPEKTRAALEAMRARARSAGLPGLHIAACGGTDRPSLEILKQAGFDSITGYNYLRTGAVAIHSPYRQFLLGHEALWQGIQKSNVLPYTPLLTVGWDARPWHGPRTERKFARRTRDFAEALRHLKANLDATGGRTAILEAWNEWGEGSYIEPNAEFGFNDLEAIREVFAQPGGWPSNIGPADVGQEGRYDLRLRAQSRPE